MDDTAIELVTAVELKRRASEFAIIPPYPAGYVQVPCPTPWELSHVALAMVALVAGLRSVRTLLRTTAPPLGRRAGCWLHGHHLLNRADRCQASLPRRALPDAHTVVLCHL